MAHNLLMFSVLVGLFFLVGCQQNTDDKANSDAVVHYEYLSLDEDYTEEINNWLSEARRNKDEELYHLSLDNGEEYVYGKGYNKGKVRYTYEEFDGKNHSSIKATLLKGESTDEVFIRITSNKEVDSITLDMTDDATQFYN